MKRRLYWTILLVISLILTVSLYIINIEQTINTSLEPHNNIRPPEIEVPNYIYPYATPPMIGPEKTDRNLRRILEENYLVDRIVASFDHVKVVTGFPESLEINNESQITMYISLTETIDKLLENIEYQCKKDGYEIRTSRDIEALLSAVDESILISSQSATRQHLVNSAITQWTWIIIGKKEGIHNISLSINAYYSINGVEKKRNIKVIVKPITIYEKTEEKIISSIKNNWIVVVSSIIVPIIALYIELKYKIVRNTIKKRNKRRNNRFRYSRHNIT
jgi:hypothetical protein